MPKIPGRAETRLKVAFEYAVIANFMFPWDKRALGVCCIKGCDHRNEQCIATEVTGPAAIYDERKYNAGHPDPYVGVACMCHVKELLAVDT